MAIRRSKFYASVSMSSTADIAFLLLIFFMVSSVLKVDADIPLVLPDAAGQKLKDKDTMVSISKHGNFYLNSLKLNMPELVSRIRAELMTRPDLTVNIQAHKDLDFETVNVLLHNFREAGVTKFSMVTKAEK